ncbi:MAG: hypothetical protein LBS21_00380 [Clostridiales bacterium]|nr:hypothetical protein [Clostridiales bacterium]
MFSLFPGVILPEFIGVIKADVKALLNANNKSKTFEHVKAVAEMAAQIAGQDFGITDERVLSAVECHTTLKNNPSAYDMALFTADKLAWDQDGLPPFDAVVRGALTQSLEAASLAYMEYIVTNKMILFAHKWFEEGLQFLRPPNFGEELQCNSVCQH